jgi:putative ABC transport system substrate-binding protein
MPVIIGRRELIAALGGAAAGWPLSARAQQPAMPVIGFLGPASPGPYAPYVASFRQGLREGGYVEGQNVAIDYRWAENQNDRLPALAAELVRRQVSVIVTLATGAMAAKAATTTIPVVFLLGDDPVRLGLVASLARPGGNMTGLNLFSGEMSAKRMEILREILPGATRVAVLVNPTGPNAETTLRDVPPAASTIGLDVRIFKANTSREISAAFEILARERPDALLVDLDPFLTSRRVQLVRPELVYSRIC